LLHTTPNRYAFFSAAGVFEDGGWNETTRGCPQGSVIRHLLSNAYLHYVLDVWIQANPSSPLRAPSPQVWGEGKRAELIRKKKLDKRCGTKYRHKLTLLCIITSIFQSIFILGG
jgi:retron-type reverse transcriptase